MKLAFNRVVAFSAPFSTLPSLRYLNSSFVNRSSTFSSSSSSSRSIRTYRRTLTSITTATATATSTATMAQRVKLPSDYTADVLRPGLGEAVNIAPGAPLETITTDLLIIAIKSPQDADADADFELPGKVASFDSERVHRALAECVTESEFTAKSGTSTDIVRIAGSAVKRCILYGIGKGEESDIAKVAAFAVEKATGKTDSVALYIDGGADEFITTIAEAANIAAYKDERYKGPKDEKKKNDKSPPSEILLVGTDSVPASDVARGKAIAAGIMATKDVVTAPANSLTPEGLADAARLVAKEADLEIQILDREACLEKGMGLYLGVTQGSIREPQFSTFLCCRPSERTDEN